MKSSRTNAPVSSRIEQVVPIFAAFLGLGITLWVNNRLGIQPGDAAVAAYFLIGIPIYKLFMESFYLFQRLRLKMPQLTQQQSVYRIVLPRLAATVTIIGKLISTP